MSARDTVQQKFKKLAIVVRLGVQKGTSFSVTACCGTELRYLRFRGEPILWCTGSDHDGRCGAWLCLPALFCSPRSLW